MCDPSLNSQKCPLIGGDLEIYWKIYTQHNRGHVVEHVMAPYKIGELSEKDMKQVTSETHYDDSAHVVGPQEQARRLSQMRYPTRR